MELFPPWEDLGIFSASHFNRSQSDDRELCHWFHGVIRVCLGKLNYSCLDVLF